MTKDELDKFIDLFFFDPQNRENDDDYIKKYAILCPDRLRRERGYRISPLYHLLKDMRYCYGLRKFHNEKAREQAPDFAGLVLINIAYTNLVKRVYGKKDIERFALRYMGLTKNQAHILRLLRNALEHGFYGLRTYDKDNQRTVYFSLSYDYDLIEESNETQDVLYRVNPRKIFSKFNDGIRSFHAALKTHTHPNRKDFKKLLNLDNWSLRSLSEERINELLEN